MNLLANKIAVVTGAAQGIGLAIAEAYAAQGAHVVVADIDSTGAERATRAIKERGYQATALTLDVANEQSVTSMITEVIDTLGRLDVLVNNAAVLHADYVIDCPWKPGSVSFA
ncbi:MAG: SDR family NAD(P)-dependent oxidoreductase [Chloroflexota bacterium]